MPMVSADPDGTTSLYSAFISYSHIDAARAAWLQQRLEAYAIPGSLVGRPGPAGPLPRRLKRVFRDAAELSVGDLTAEIREALERSDALIVVCSPAAVASPWVGREIVTFKALAQPPRIFPVIVAGEPHAKGKSGFTAADECFPEALTHRVATDGSVLEDLDTEFIAADLRVGHDGEETGFLRLMAGLLGVGLDELVQREKQAEKRRRLMWTGIAAGAGALALAATGAAGVALYQQRRAHEALVQLLPEHAREIFEQQVAQNAVRHAGLANAARLTLAGLTLGPEHRQSFRALLARLIMSQEASGVHAMRVTCLGGGRAGVAAGQGQGAQTPVVALDDALDVTGKRLVFVCPDQSVHVWDVDNGRDVATLPRSRTSVLAATFAADSGTILVGWRDGAVRTWSIGGAETTALAAQDASPPIAAVPPPASSMALLADHAPAPLRPAAAPLFDRYGASATSVAVSGNGHVAVAQGAAPAVVTIQSPSPLGASPVVLRDVMSEGVTSLAFSADSSRLVTTDQEGRTRIWNALDGRSLMQIPTNLHLLGASFSGDGRRLVISEEGQAVVWDVSPMGESLSELVDDTCRVVLAKPGSRAFPKKERAKDPLILELWSEEGLSENTDLCVAAAKAAKASR